MQAVVYEGSDSISFSERPPASLKQDEVLVEVADFGICCTASRDITAGQRVAVETLLNCSSCRTCCSLSRGG